MSEQAYELPPEHPVSGVTTAWHDGNLIVLVIFARIGRWAITQCAHAGREHPPVEPWLGIQAVTWLGEDHNYGRRLGAFIGYADQETEILEALQPWDPSLLKSAFGEDGPTLRGEDRYIDTEVIKSVEVPR